MPPVWDVKLTYTTQVNHNILELQAFLVCGRIVFKCYSTICSDFNRQWHNLFSCIPIRNRRFFKRLYYVQINSSFIPFVWSSKHIKNPLSGKFTCDCKYLKY